MVHKSGTLHRGTHQLPAASSQSLRRTAGRPHEGGEAPAGRLEIVPTRNWFVDVKLLIYTLVGGFNHLEKYESQWEGLSHIYYEKLKMFETTNQIQNIHEKMSLDISQSVCRTTWKNPLHYPFCAYPKCLFGTCHPQVLRFKTAIGSTMVLRSDADSCFSRKVPVNQAESSPNYSCFLISMVLLLTADFAGSFALTSSLSKMNFHRPLHCLEAPPQYQQVSKWGRPYGTPNYGPLQWSKWR